MHEKEYSAERVKKRESRSCSTSYYGNRLGVGSSKVSAFVMQKDKELDGIDAQEKGPSQGKERKREQASLYLGM